MIKFWSRYKYWIIIAVVFLFLRLPSLFEPYWYGDEGIYLTLGQGIRKGLLLYSQTHDNKPPTLYYLAALSQTVFGFRLLLTLVMIPTIFFFYKLALYFLSPKLVKISTFIFLILTSIPTLEGNIANAEIFMLLPTVLGVWYFLNASKNIHYITSGLLLGIAFTIKVPAFIEVFFLVVWFILVNLPNLKKHFWSLLLKLFLFGFSFLIPILIYFAYFSIKGASSIFLKSALLQNFSYLSSWASGTQTAPASSGGLMTRLIFMLIFWLIIYILQFKKIISQKVSFLLFWFGATFFGVLLSTRPYPHYLIQSLPPFCLLIPFLFISKINKAKIVIVTTFILTFILIKKYQFYFYPTLKYYSNFYSFKSTTSYNQFFGNQVNNNYQIASFIQKNTTSKDKIFIWGDEPYVYALADRLPPGRYTVAYHIVDFNGYQETIDAIKSHPPKFIAYYSMSNRPFFELSYLLKRYYFLDHIFGSVLVFQKR